MNRKFGVSLASILGIAVAVCFLSPAIVQAQQCPTNTYPVRLPQGGTCLTRAQIDNLQRQQAAEQQRHQEMLRRQQQTTRQQQASSGMPPGCYEQGRTMVCPRQGKADAGPASGLPQARPGAISNPLPPGCVNNGRTMSCPGDQRHVEVQPMAPRVQLQPMAPRVQPQQGGQATSSAPSGNDTGPGITQAQVDGWEFARRNAWNGTGAEMIYGPRW